MSTGVKHMIRTLLIVSLVVARSAAQPVPPAGGAGQLSGGPQETGWPRTYAKGEQQVLLYQPQIDDWQNHSKISFRSALAVTAAGRGGPAYGVLAVTADTFVDHNTRTVLMTALNVDVRFPNLSEQEAQPLQALVREVLPHKECLAISLDRVLAYMDPAAATLPAVNLNLDPPPILRSEAPAILVIFAGQPQFKPVQGASLMFAVNTNWDVLLDLQSSQYYLLNGDSWLTAPDVLQGPWIAAPGLPPAFSDLPIDHNWEDLRQHIPGQVATSAPRVFTSTKPEELIVTQGPPEYSPLDGTQLLYVSNPVQPLFMDGADRSYYYLVAGRWFRAASLDGPWSAASAHLPQDFSRIPADSPMGSVLACVPHTQQAKDAILLASIPNQAAIKRESVSVQVTYDGAPEFAGITGTRLEYAMNSPYDVILAEGQYYCCYQGVWFVAPASSGPWVVCASVPAAIYTIPPSCPLYNDTYVRVYSATPDTVVVGYTAGYSGEYVAATGTLMFGAGVVTGTALAAGASWYHSGAAYLSYGCAAAYHYGYGGYFRGAAHYGPYGGAGCYAAYNAESGVFSRGAYRYGPAGAGVVHQAYNPFTNTYRGHAEATNGYQSWGHSAVTRGDEWAASGHVSGAAGSAGWVDTSTGRSAVGAQGAGGGTAVKTSSGDVYAGKDGNVYRKPEDGDWQHWNGGGWQNAERSSPTSANPQFHQQMNNEYAARSRSNELQSRSERFQGGAGRWRR
jgi:hypothetical protein